MAAFFGIKRFSRKNNMKKTGLICSLLLAACLAVPAAAQDAKSLTTGVARMIRQAQQKHQESHARCTACGEEITASHQHCSATDYTGLCTAAPAQKGADAPVCAACGEEITDSYQHCSAADYTGLCSASPKRPQTDKSASVEPSACPRCGQAYTIDEKYHGQTHHCQFLGDREEPQPATFENPDIIYQAEELLQADRDAHGGNAVHSLEYYYQLLTAKQAQGMKEGKPARSAAISADPHAEESAD